MKRASERWRERVPLSECGWGVWNEGYGGTSEVRLLADVVFGAFLRRGVWEGRGKSSGKRVRKWKREKGARSLRDP